MRNNPDHFCRILEALDAESELTQRALAGRLGIALGRTNYLLRQLLALRWIRHERTHAPHGRYFVTEDGQSARVRMTRESLHRALISYRAVERRVREGLEACVNAHPIPEANGKASVALYGTGDVAQIVFTCAADLGIDLVGFVEEGSRESFLGLPVRTPAEARWMALDGRPFHRLLVASFGEDADIRGSLETLQFPLERVSWL